MLINRLLSRMIYGSQKDHKNLEVARRREEICDAKLAADPKIYQPSGTDAGDPLGGAKGSAPACGGKDTAIDLRSCKIVIRNVTILRTSYHEKVPVATSCKGHLRS